MERDLSLSTKQRERRERKKKTSRKAEASEWDIEAAWVEFINDNGPYELLDTVAKVRQPWFNVADYGRASLFAAKGVYQSERRLGKRTSSGTTGKRAGKAVLECRAVSQK